MSTIKLVGLSGSLRGASTNGGLLRKAAELGSKHRIELKIISCDLPLYNQDLETQTWPASEGPNFPSSVRELRAAISESDGILFAAEEFNWSVSGVLKNAIDWASRGYSGAPAPFSSKVAGIVGAGGMMGTARAQLALRQILTECNVLAMPKPEFTLNRFTSGVFSPAGDLIDETTIARLDKYLAALAAFAEAQKKAKL